MTLQLDFPSRARSALLPTVLLKAGPHRATLGPLSIRRLALMHSLETPLFYPRSRLGAGLGWLASAYVLWDRADDRRLVRVLAEKGAGAVAEEACQWAEEVFPGADVLAPCMDSVRALWRDLCALDPAPGDGSEEVSASGESSPPATAPLRSSPAGR